jgi:reactive intermediate/imine deaminase
MKQAIQTNKAPAAIGSYSQAIQVGKMVFFSGQIPLDPETMTLIDINIKIQANQVFKNLKKVADAAGIDFSAIVKLNVYLTDISQLSVINEVMMEYFKQPYPARTSVEVAALPKGAAVEIEAIAVTG